MDNISIETSTIMDLKPIATQGQDFGLIINAIVKIIYFSVIVLLGLFGNILILRVYWSKPNKTTTHILIMGLAWTDLAVCMMRVYRIATLFSFLATGKNPDATRYGEAIGLIFLFACIVVTSFIAVDRYDCVCRSNNRWINSGRRAKLMMFVAYGLAIAFAFPYLIHNFWFPYSIPLKLIFLSLQFVMYIALLLVICVCYGRVYLAVRKHVKVNALSGSHARNGLSEKRRATDSHSQHDGSLESNSNSSTSRPQSKAPIHRNDQSIAAAPGNPNSADRPSGNNETTQDKGNAAMPSLQRKTTRMLFMTSVVLLVTWFPSWLFLSLRFAQINGSNISDSLIQVLWFSSPSVYINNIVNPVIYGLANSRFRKDCLAALKKFKMC